MTEPITRTLTTLADAAPDIAFTEDFWRAGRRQRRRARVRAAVATVAALVAFAGAAGQFGPDTLAVRVPAGAGQETHLPGAVGEPWPWQAPVSQWPGGPAVMVFGHLSWLDAAAGSNPIAILHASGAYRMWERKQSGRSATELTPVLGRDVLLSPDGRRLVRGAVSWDELMVVVDMTTGVETAVPEPASSRAASSGGDVDRRAEAPVAWSADGRRLLTELTEVVLDGSGNGTDTQFYRVHDLVTGEVRQMGEGWRGQFWRFGAFSPDGQSIVVPNATGELQSFDVATGRVRWTRASGLLAGPAAWTPDGKSIAVLVGTGCREDCASEQEGIADERVTWRLEFIDAATGEPRRGDPRSRALAFHPHHLLGWRPGGQPVFDADLHTTFGWVDDTGELRVMLALALPVAEVDVARDALENAVFDAPAPQPAPWEASWSAVLLAAGAVLFGTITAVAIRLVVARRRRRVDDAGTTVGGVAS